MKNDDKLYRTAEGMLYNYKNLKAQIKNIELDIEERVNDYNTLSAVQYDKDKISKTYKFNSEVENKVIDIESAQRDLKSETNFLKAKKRSKEIQVERIDNILSVLTEEEYKLIELRYFKEMQFKDIADILCKSDIYLMQLRRKIITEKMIPLISN